MLLIASELRGAQPFMNYCCNVGTSVKLRPQDSQEPIGEEEPRELPKLEEADEDEASYPKPFEYG